MKNIYLLQTENFFYSQPISNRDISNFELRRQNSELI